MSITRIKDRAQAQDILEDEDWDLDSSIDWFHQHKDDDEWKEWLKTEDECNLEQTGKFTYNPNAV